MKIDVVEQSPETLKTDWLLVGVHEGGDAPVPPGKLGELLGPRLVDLREAGDFDGKQGETLLLYESLGTAARRVLLVGLGKVESATPMSISKAAGSALRAVIKKKHDTIAAPVWGEATSLDLSPRTAAMVAGLLIAEGGQDLYRTKKNRKPPESFLLAGPAPAEAVQEGVVLGESVRWAAELVNYPPADIYPQSFCDRIQAGAEGLDVEVEVFDASRLASERMECILGVGRESTQEPRLLVLRYSPLGKDEAPTAFVGKGVTFDSGGLSLKTADGMMTMKCDMAGAAAVAVATLAIARLKIPANILCVCPLVENMPGGRSIKPGDVLRARNGKTIEVLNTDAEGRLILADALSYATDQGAARIIDLATLTGACMVALGMEVAGLMSNDEAWSHQVQETAQGVGERIWPLPMHEEYGELIKSGIADMKNIGGRWGGAITAAKLLENFLDKTPWVHLDIAGPAFTEKESSHQDAGGTGFFVRSLVALARALARKDG